MYFRLLIVHKYNERCKTLFVSSLAWNHQVKSRTYNWNTTLHFIPYYYVFHPYDFSVKIFRFWFWNFVYWELKLELKIIFGIICTTNYEFSISILFTQFQLFLFVEKLNYISWYTHRSECEWVRKWWQMSMRR